MRACLSNNVFCRSLSFQRERLQWCCTPPSSTQRKETRFTSLPRITTTLSTTKLGKPNCLLFRYIKRRESTKKLRCKILWFFPLTVPVRWTASYGQRGFSIRADSCRTEGCRLRLQPTREMIRFVRIGRPRNQDADYRQFIFQQDDEKSISFEFRHNLC